MAGSNAFRNRGTLPALSDAAASATKSSTSCAGSAARQQAASGISNRTRRVISGPVAGIDPDIALRKVAGPEARFAFSLPANRQPDFAVRGVQLRLQLLLGKRCRQSTFTDRDTLHVDVGFRRSERDARVTRRGEYT